MNNAEKQETIGTHDGKKENNIYENWIIDAFSLKVILFIKHNQDGSSLLNSVWTILHDNVTLS